MQSCMLSHFSCVRLFATLWTEAHQTPLSKGFSGQEYWSGLLFPPPGNLPDPGIGSASVYIYVCVCVCVCVCVLHLLLITFFCILILKIAA